MEQQYQQADAVFHEVEEPAYRYQWENLQDYTELVKAFYAIDSTTAAGTELLNTEKLLSKDMRMQGGNDEPQILIYHTHSQEAFVDSIPGDESTTIDNIRCLRSASERKRPDCRPDRDFPAIQSDRFWRSG